MNSLHQFLGQGNKLWESLQTSATETLEVSEIWQSEPEPATLRTVHRPILQTGISKWLQDTRSEVPNSQGQQCLLRVVWITRLVKQRLDDVAATALAEVTKAFDQELAQEYCASCYSGVGTLPQTPRGTRSYFFCTHPKIALSWSQERNSTTTNVICIAEESKIRTMRESLECSFVQIQADHGMVVGLICSILLSREIDTAQSTIKQKVREVEVRTGYHEWQSRSESPALGDLESLSATMSGCGTRTAALIRKIEVLQQLTSFTSEQFAQSRDDHRHTILKRQEFEAHLETLVRRAKMQQIDANFFALRTKTQLTAVSQNAYSRYIRILTDGPNDKVVPYHSAERCRTQP
jgi:hypothetical protein